MAMSERAQALQDALELVRRGAFSQAEEVLRSALGPDAAPDYLNALGNALAGQGRVDEAEAAYQQALSKEPTFYKSLNNLANLRRNAGSLEQAVELYRRALATEPKSHRAHANLGTTLLLLGRFDEAAGSFERSLDLSDGTGVVWARYAEARSQLGQVDQAIEACEKSIALSPGHADLHQAYGNLLERHGKLPQAQSQLERAAELAPGSARVLADLGVVQHAARMREAAAKTLTRSIEIERSAHALNALGLVRNSQGRTTEGLELLRQASLLEPNTPEFRANLGGALIVRGQVIEAVAELRDASKGARLAAAHSSLCMALHYDDAFSKDEVYREHRRWAARYADPITALAPIRQPRNLDAERTLKVGYLSADVRSHSVATFLEPILRGHDPDQVSTFMYSNVERPDQVTDRFRELVGSRFRDVRGLPDERLAAQIRQDGIDIMVDLGGHTADSRLAALAYRPAPIQVTYLGYPGTTGMRAIDYRITDAIADPEGELEDPHCEEAIRLPEGAWCFGDPARFPPVRERAAEATVVFGSFNNLAKLRGPVLEAWATILNRVANSRLFVKAKGLLDASVREDLFDRLAALGVSRERVELAGWTGDRTSHVERYAELDIALDTFPYNGTTTTCEALAMGVPVLTLTGDRHAGRVGTSLLRGIGLPDLCAATAEDYIRMACELAEDQPRRAQLRRDLRRRMSANALGDSERFVPQLEAAYRSMWRRHCAQDGLDLRLFHTLPLPGVDKLYVPRTLTNLSSYVLREQGDWFEDEVHFVRRLLKPGERALDVGANVGMYALSMATRVGAQGRVWAFEPAPATATLLQASKEANRLSQLTIEQVALSDRGGTTSFFISPDSELNSLHADAVGSVGQRIEVELSTLDDAAERLGISNIQFVKLDAEGEERAILDGARALLAREEPLVMYELKHGKRVNEDLVEHFASIGFGAYRLVPGLGALVPFDLSGAPDPFLLNLFACPRETAERLAARGLLIPELPNPLAVPPGKARVEHAVERYRWAVHGTGPMAVRAAELRGAMLELKLHVADDPAMAMAFARVAAAWGERGAAVGALSAALQQLRRSGTSLEQILLAPLPRFDELAIPAGEEDRLAKGMVIVALEELSNFSSFFCREKSRLRLAELDELGFRDEPMERRRASLDELRQEAMSE